MGALYHELPTYASVSTFVQRENLSAAADRFSVFIQRRHTAAGIISCVVSWKG